MATLDAFLSRFTHLHPQGPDRWRAACPAHDDRSQDTLSLAVGRDGRRLAYCWAGCDIGDILRAVGLAWRDCFEDDGRTGPAPPGRPPRRDRVAEAFGARMRATERRSGPYTEIWDEADLIRETRRLVDRLRAWATTLDPNVETPWRLLAVAAELETDALNREAAQDAAMRVRR